MIAKIRHCCSAKIQSINKCEFVFYFLSLANRSDKGSVKISVVRDKHSLTRKLDKRFHCFFFLRCVCNHIIGYTGNLGDFIGDRNFGVYKRLELLNYLSVLEFNSAYLGYSVVLSIQSRSLKVKYDYLSVNKIVRTAGNKRSAVVDKVRFNTVYHLHLLVVAVYCFNCIHRFGIRLQIAVVGYRNSGVSPLISLLDKLRRGSYRVHIGHICVHVQLHTLLFGIVLAGMKFQKRHTAWTNIQFLRERIKFKFALHYQRLAVGDVFLYGVGVFAFGDYFKYLRGRFI